MRVTGWGRLCGECEQPDTLQGISIPVLSEEECGLTAEDRFCVADEEVSMCFVSIRKLQMEHSFGVSNLSPIS